MSDQLQAENRSARRDRLHHCFPYLWFSLFVFCGGYTKWASLDAMGRHSYDGCPRPGCLIPAVPAALTRFVVARFLVTCSPVKSSAKPDVLQMLVSIVLAALATVYVLSREGSKPLCCFLLAAPVVGALWPVG